MEVSVTIPDYTHIYPACSNLPDNFDIIGKEYYIDILITQSKIKTSVTDLSNGNVTECRDIRSPQNDGTLPNGHITSNDVTFYIGEVSYFTITNASISSCNSSKTPTNIPTDTPTNIPTMDGKYIEWNFKDKIVYASNDAWNNNNNNCDKFKIYLNGNAKITQNGLECNGYSGYTQSGFNKTFNEKS